MGHSSMCVQVKGHSLLGRQDHSATAFTLSPGVTEVVIFGGWDSYSRISRTTVLRWGESTLRCMCPPLPTLLC